MSFDFADLAPLVPMLILVGMGCLVLLAETMARSSSRAGLAWLSAAGCAAALVSLAMRWDEAAVSATVLQGMWVTDRMALFIDSAFALTGLVTVLLSGPYLREHGFEAGEFYALVLFGVAGMMMVAHASHLLSLLIGIETMSLAAYVLTGSWRRSARSSEGALKYFLMGAFATGFLVYGMALIYGLTGGELSYAGIASKARDASASPLFLIGFYFILATFIFKVAAVPFHFWAPDAYEGAPTPAAGFMAAGVKAAAFVGLMRLLGGVFGGSALPAGETGWVPVVSLVAIVTMTFGNLAALRQDNIKRMLAYSSVAHAGYLLVGVAAQGLAVPEAQASLLFYLMAYTFTTLGTFGVVAWVGRRNDERLYVDDWAGLASARPALALAMTVFLLSLGGVPPTAGFFGKFYLFRSAMERSELYPLVIAGVLNSVISMYYYLRVVVAMYFREPLRPHEPFAGPSMRVALVLTAVAVVGLGLLPSAVVDWAAGGASGAGASVAAVVAPAPPP
jgi:NADH-quinone oxidoreductase subunit N